MFSRFIHITMGLYQGAGVLCKTVFTMVKPSTIAGLCKYTKSLCTIMNRKGVLPLLEQFHLQYLINCYYEPRPDHGNHHQSTINPPRSTLHRNVYSCTKGGKLDILVNNAFQDPAQKDSKSDELLSKAGMSWLVGDRRT